MRPIMAQKLMAISGRWAILARIDENSPWVQVESIVGSESAEAYIDDLENDDKERAEVCRSMEGEGWGDNAPEHPEQAA